MCTAGAIRTLLLTVRGWFNGVMEKRAFTYRERHRHSMTLSSISRFHRHKLGIWCSSTVPTMRERM